MINILILKVKPIIHLLPLSLQNQVSYNESGNSVDIDQEMADLATNQIYYNALTERISGKFSSLQNVIRGGK